MAIKTYSLISYIDHTKPHVNIPDEIGQQLGSYGVDEIKRKALQEYNTAKSVLERSIANIATQDKAALNFAGELYQRTLVLSNIAVELGMVEADAIDAIGASNKDNTQDAGFVELNPLAIQNAAKDNLREWMSIPFKAAMGFAKELFNNRDNIERINNKLIEKGYAWQINKDIIKQLPQITPRTPQGVFTFGSYVAFQRNKLGPITFDYNNSDTIAATESGEKTIGGISDKTDYILTMAHLLGMLDNPLEANKEKVKWDAITACLGYMINGDEHSSYEVLTAARSFGLAYRAGPNSYTYIRPGDEEFLNQLRNAQKERDWKMPDEYLSGAYIMELVERELILQSIDRNQSIEKTLESYPNDLEIIAAAYKRRANSIRGISPDVVFDLIGTTISNKDAITLFPDNDEVVFRACRGEPKLITLVSLDKIWPLIGDSISFEDALQALPYEERIISAAYAKDPALIQYANLSAVLELIGSPIQVKDVLLRFPECEDKIKIIQKAYNKYQADLFPLLDELNELEACLVPLAAIKGFPADKTMVSWVYKKEPDLLKNASPELVAELVGAIIPCEHAIKVFPSHPNVVLAVYKKEPHLIQLASPITVRELIGKGITAEDAIKAFPNDKKIVPLACSQNANLIKFTSPKIIREIIGKEVGYEDAIKASPNNEEIVLTVYRIDPLLIQYASVSTLVTLIKKKMITPIIALALFPDNEELTNLIDTPEFQNAEILQSEQELVALVKLGLIEPHSAVNYTPKSVAVVTAAYKKNPTSIQCADREIINQLGGDGIISKDDVIKVFALSQPTIEQIEETGNQLQQALKDKNWPKVLEIGQMFWFERPEKTNITDIKNLLINQEKWNDVYDFECACQPNQYELTEGPINKAQETYELEQLTQKMMERTIFTVQSICGEDHFVFADQTSFNWTKIQANANLQDITLGESHIKSYATFLSKDRRQGTLSLDSKNEYKSKLYRISDPQEPDKTIQLPIPDDPITFEEMQAINIYTGDSFYHKMNGLLRDEVSQFNYRESKTSDPTSESPGYYSKPLENIRSALVHSVMAASGLKKLPQITVTEAYRGSSPGNRGKPGARIKESIGKHPYEARGFFSTSLKKQATNEFTAGVSYTIQELRGVNIAPISQNEQEAEILALQPTLKLMDYKYLEGVHQFITRMVSDAAYRDKVTQSSESVLINPFIDYYVFKILNAYHQFNTPNEELIRTLLCTVCKTEDGFSADTEKVKYLIAKMKESPQLCVALGIDPQPELLDEHIKELINHVHEPIGITPSRNKS